MPRKSFYMVYKALSDMSKNDWKKQIYNKDLLTVVLTTFLSKLISPSKVHLFSNGFFLLKVEMLLVPSVYDTTSYVV